MPKLCEPNLQGVEFCRKSVVVKNVLGFGQQENIAEVKDLSLFVIKGVEDKI